MYHKRKQYLRQSLPKIHSRLKKLFSPSFYLLALSCHSKSFNIFLLNIFLNITNTLSTVQFFMSARGSRMLLLRGNKYRINKAQGRKIRWRCATHERYSCRARVHTIDNEIVYFIDEHITEEFITGDN